MSGIAKKLSTGATLRAWNFEESNAAGQTMAIKNSNGDFEPFLHAEAVNCAQGTCNRVVFKKSVLEKLGWIVIEE